MKSHILTAVALIVSFIIGFSINYSKASNSVQEKESAEVSYSVEVNELKKDLVTCKLNYDALASNCMKEDEYEIPK